MNHLHFLLYIPTIAFIVIIRYYVQWPATAAKIVAGFGALAFLSATFITALQANARVAPETLFLYMQSRALDPLGTEFLRIWYWQPDVETPSVWAAFPKRALRIPVYLLLIGLHLPLIRFFKSIVSTLAVRQQRMLVLIGLGVINAAYPIMWIVIHDQARLVSSWAVCMLLSMHAVMMLPSSPQIPSASFDTPVNRLFAWVITLIPRVGIVTPF